MVGGVEIYIKRWLSDNPTDPKEPPLIGINDGINSLEFGNAEDLSNFMLEPKGMNLPTESMEEVALGLALLATKLQWILIL